MRNKVFMLNIALLILISIYLITWNQSDVIDEKSVDSTVVENQKEGSDHWKINNPTGAIEGYSSSPSVEAGDWISFHVNSKRAYKMEMYRLGYYNDTGGRLLFTSKWLESSIQEEQESSEGCHWPSSFRFQVPINWPSGFYLSKLVDAFGKEKYIPFVVTKKNSKATYAVLIATNSYHAYNNWGGKSLYAYNSSSGVQGKKVSYHRPYKESFGAGSFFQYEFNLIRWLEKEGYDLTYVTDMDVHNGILEHSKAKALLIAGHAEYWTMQMRENIEKATASKMNLANFSANVGYWQVRIEQEEKYPDNPVIVAYKQFALNQDPYCAIHPELVTTRFRDAPVSKPEDLVLGTKYIGIPKKAVPLVVTNPSHWLYKGTGLKEGEQIPGVIGGEVDGFYNLPKGEVIARSPVVLYGQKQDATVVWYTKPSGKKAFSVGTFYWNWFLDPINHSLQAHEDKRIQQITRNALRELAK